MSVRVALFVSLAVAACAAPVPPVPTQVLPTQSVPPTTIATGSQAPTPLEHVQYQSDNVSFEYPADWRVIAADDPCYEFHRLTYVAIGTGDWISPCDGGALDGGTAIAAPGQVVVTISYFFSGPMEFAFDVPPFDAAPLQSGLAAVIQGSKATVFVPDHRTLDVEATYGESPTELDTSVFEHLVQTIDLQVNPPDLPLAISTSERDLPAEDCVRATFTGRLAYHGPVLLTPESGVMVRWPQGWRIVSDGSGRLALVDANGDPVARVWDEISVGGRGSENDFHACPESVGVITPFPLD